MNNIKMEVSDKLEYSEIIKKGLGDFNYKNSLAFTNKERKNDNKEFNIYLFDNEKIIGGMLSFTKENWIIIEDLWINENYRGKNLGTRLMNEIEKIAEINDITGILVETWDFQAKGFYEKCGYILKCTIEDFPVGLTEYRLIKMIKK